MNIYKNPFSDIEIRTKHTVAVLEKRPEIFVHDFGCNVGLLKHMLGKTNKVYAPYDSYEVFPGVYVVDFNDSFPQISTSREQSICVCTGLFEYIYNVPEFVQKIYCNFSALVFSYLDVDLMCGKDNKAKPQNMVELLPIDKLIKTIKLCYATVTPAYQMQIQSVYLAC